MEIYNHNKGVGEIRSLITFVNTYKPIVEKVLFFVEYEDGKNKIFLDKDNYLYNLYCKKLNEKDLLKETDNLIKKIHYVRRYYSFIKVLKDEDGSLINKEFIFYYGIHLKNTIVKYLSKNNRFKNVFYLTKNKNMGFTSYDDSGFIDDVFEYNNYQLDMENHLNFKEIELPYILQRKDKILKIKNRIGSNQIS